VSWKYGLPSGRASSSGGGPFAAVISRGFIPPEFAGQGVGAGLLEMVERLMRERGIQAVQAEASSNAREFYLRRGYRVTGPQTPKAAWPIEKNFHSRLWRS
jgi:GNAT superfamily N-acetyltransferase